MKYVEIALKRPFPIGSVSFRKGPGGGKELAYITARDVMQRLDEVLLMDGWQDEYEHVGGRMICKLSCRIGGKWITKSDGADDTSIEGAKGGISDSFKRAAVKYGIFRYGYHPLSYIGRVPAEWATPEGYDKLMEKIHKKEIDKWRKEYEASL
jgi:hypothetical protein